LVNRLATLAAKELLLIRKVVVGAIVATVGTRYWLLISYRSYIICICQPNAHNTIVDGTKMTLLMPKIYEASFTTT
jgi:hypothetical protein